MANTTINEAKTLTLIDGTEINVRPLKVSLLREFMKKFDDIVKVAEDNDKTIGVLLECVQIAMRQYKPELADDIKALEDNIDLPTVYQIVEEAAGIKMAEAMGVAR
jgi:inhibitor of KinA sporulation pathway (predicted exonuclease)